MEFTERLNFPGRSFEAARVMDGSCPELVKAEPLAGIETAAAMEISGHAQCWVTNFAFAPSPKSFGPAMGLFAPKAWTVSQE